VHNPDRDERSAALAPVGSADLTAPPLPTEAECWQHFARVLGRMAFEQYRAKLRRGDVSPVGVAA
jgi:hypothetical protein